MEKKLFFEELGKSDDMVDFFHKYIVHGIPEVFSTEHEYFNFRKEIANNFKINYFEVYIVGSAKLGFSYYKDTDFSLESDIDVVMLNSDLFDKYSHEVTAFQYRIDSGEIVLSEKEVKQYIQFKDYLIKGWLRPDKIPAQLELHILKREWFDFFKSISYGKRSFGNYKVAAGLFKDLYSLEKYYATNLQRIQRKNW